MHVAITSAELEGLVSLARGKTIPLTASTDTRVDSGFALNADSIEADWALAQLANVRLDVNLRLAAKLEAKPVNEPGDRGLTDQESQRLRTVVSAAFGACPPDASEADRIATVAAHVRGWLDTLT